MARCVVLRSVRSLCYVAYRQQYADNQNISFLPAIVSTSTRMHGEFLRLLFLQAHRETESHFTAAGMSSQTKQLGSTPVQARGILQRSEEQSRTGGCQSSSVEDQPQCPGLWHSARSLSHSPSAPPPSFTQSPYPPRSLVRDGQTSPHRPRLVVSRSTCPSLS
jgi:hypothetical protein